MSVDVAVPVPTIRTADPRTVEDFGVVTLDLGAGERPLTMPQHPLRQLVVRCGGDVALVNELLERWWPAPEITVLPVAPGGRPFQAWVPVPLVRIPRPGGVAEVAATVMVAANPASAGVRTVGAVYASLELAQAAAEAANTAAGMPAGAAAQILEDYAVGVSRWWLPTLGEVLQMSEPVTAEQVEVHRQQWQAHLEAQLGKRKELLAQADLHEDVRGRLLAAAADEYGRLIDELLRERSDWLHVPDPSALAPDYLARPARLAFDVEQVNAYLAAMSAALEQGAPALSPVEQMLRFRLTPVPAPADGVPFEQWQAQTLEEARSELAQMEDEESRAAMRAGIERLTALTADGVEAEAARMIARAATVAGGLYGHAAQHPDTKAGQVLSADPAADADRLLSLRGHARLSPDDEDFLRDRYANAFLLLEDLPADLGQWPSVQV